MGGVDGNGNSLSCGPNWERMEERVWSDGEVNTAQRVGVLNLELS